MIIFESAHITPREVERITGVNPLTQRMWRSRGFLAKKERSGHGMSLEDLVHYMLMAQINRDCRTELELCARMAAAAAPSVIRIALDHAQIAVVVGKPTDAELESTRNSASTAIRSKFVSFDGTRIRLSQSLRTILDGSLPGIITAHLPPFAKRLLNEVNCPLLRVWAY